MSRKEQTKLEGVHKFCSTLEKQDC